MSDKPDRGGGRPEPALSTSDSGSPRSSLRTTSARIDSDVIFAVEVFLPFLPEADAARLAPPLPARALIEELRHRARAKRTNQAH